MKTETFTCDIDGCENIAIYKNKQLQVVFTTEQTEGRIVKPYLSFNNLDICQSCLDKVLINLRQITGYGAQGFNNYKI